MYGLRPFNVEAKVFEAKDSDNYILYGHEIKDQKVIEYLEADPGHCNNIGFFLRAYSNIFYVEPKLKNFNGSWFVHGRNI